MINAPVDIEEENGKGNDNESIDQKALMLHKSCL